LLFPRGRRKELCGKQEQEVRCLPGAIIMYAFSKLDNGPELILREGAIGRAKLGKLSDFARPADSETRECSTPAKGRTSET
jgi:hypothetical protein